MPNNKVLLVVPSIRLASFTRFINEWRPTGLFDRVSLCLIEDNPTKTFTTPDECVYHFSWEDIDAMEWAWIVPRRSDTVRSFGYWWAHVQGFKYLQTLDDDCYPEPGYEDLDLQHLALLDGRTRWFNTLNSVRPRGTPYYNLGSRPVHVNHGLWTNVLDYDAPQQLVNPVPEVFTHDNRIVPHGSYFSFCGMNATWKREAFVLSYHLLMGQMTDRKRVKRHPHFEGPHLKKLVMDRMGDIFSGIIMKKVADRLQWSVSSGTPYIHHDRASNVFSNLRKEAAGIEVGEWFWERIDQVDLSTVNPNPVDCYHAVGNAVGRFGGEHEEYWAELSEAMVTWADLFTEQP